MGPADERDDDHADDHSGDADGWVATGVGAPVDELQLADLDLLAELTHPTRGPLMRQLRHARSAAELAATLDVPITRLYHHLNRLEQAGLIRVAATRRAGAATERRYQVVAKAFTLADDVYDTVDNGRELAQALGSLFDVAKSRLQRELESQPSVVRPVDEHHLLSLGDLRLGAARRAELIVRLKALVDEFGSEADDPDDPSAVSGFTLFVAAFPET